MKIKKPANAYKMQKKAVQDLLTIEKRMTWKCFYKRLGFTPKVNQLIIDKVIRIVPGNKNQVELVTATV